MTSWSSSFKICFYKLIESIIFKISWEDKELIRGERRDGGEGEERGLRKGAERGYIEIERKETKGN